MERFWQADIGTVPNFLLLGYGPLDHELSDWVQPLDRWTLILYHHSGSVQVNVHTLSVEPGSMVLIPPGCHARHPRIGEGTDQHHATFILPSKSGVRHALPVQWMASEEVQKGFETATFAVGRTPEHGIAFVWYLLWQVARPFSVFRSHSELFDAEEWIIKHLAQPFKIQELADAVNSSPRTLLRLFQLEHGQTITQFVRGRRVQEAIRLLTDTNLPLKVIGARVGVTDSQQFNKLVRYATGLSPSAYRRLES